MKKKLLSIILTLAMVVSMMPAMTFTAFAAGTEYTYIKEDGTEGKDAPTTTLTSGGTLNGVYYLTGTHTIGSVTLGGNTIFIVAGNANYTFNSGITGSSYNLSVYNVKGSTSGTITINGSAGSAGQNGTFNQYGVGGNGGNGNPGSPAISVYNLNLSNVTLTCTGGSGGTGGKGAMGGTNMGGSYSSGTSGAGGAGATAVNIGSGLTIYGGTLTANGGAGGTGGEGAAGGNAKTTGSPQPGTTGGAGGAGGDAIKVLSTLKILHGGTLTATGGVGGTGGTGGKSGSIASTGDQFAKDGPTGGTGGTGGVSITGDSSHTVSISLDSNSVLKATSGDGGTGGKGGAGGNGLNSDVRYNVPGDGGNGGAGGSSQNAIYYGKITVTAGSATIQSGTQGVGGEGGDYGTGGHGTNVAPTKGNPGSDGSRGYAIGGLNNNFNNLSEHRGGDSSSASNWSTSNISTYRYIYASKWICTITFDQKGGTGGTETVDLAKGDTMSAITVPTKLGYTFDGYYDAESGGNMYYASTGASVNTTWNYNITAKTLYAHWTAHTYTIKFDTKGGSGTFADISATYDEEYTLSSDVPTLDKCKFVSWNTKEDFTGDSYAAGAKVKNLSATDGDTVTLYAQLIHAHGLWTYGATDNVITGTCGVTGCDLDDSKIALTLSAVDSVYDGKAYTGASTDDETVKFAETTEAAIGDIVYYLADGTTKTTNTNSGAAEEGAAPVNAGTYTAKVTVTYNTDQTVTATKQFKITKKALTKDDLTVTLPSSSDITYDGQGHAATAVLKTATGTDPQLTGLGTVTMMYQKKTGETTWGTATSDAPKDVGTYKVLVRTAEGDNFKATESDIDVEKTITIVPKEVTLTWQPASGEGAIDLIYSGKDKVPTVTAGNLEAGDECTVTASVTSGKDNKNVGTFTFTATELSNSNYKLPSNPISGSYTITPFTTTMDNVSQSANYDGAGHTITFSPKSPEGGDDPLKMDDFTVKYYKVDEDKGTVGDELSKATSIGKYIYVATLENNHSENYKFEDGKVLSGKPANEAAIADKVNAGIFSITVSVPTMQKPISFASGLVNKLTTDTTVTNALTNTNSGATTTYTSSNTAVATVNATTGEVTIVGAGSTTITATSHVEGMTDVYAAYTLNVSKKEITVTVTDQTITYGGENPYDEVADLAFSEEIDTTGITPTFTTSYIVGKGVNEYAVRVKLTASDKYSFIYEPGTLTVNPKPLGVSDFAVTASDKAYDGNTEAKVTAVVSSDAVLSSDELKVTAVGSFADENAANNKTVNYEITGISGAKAGNYILGTADEMKGTATANITKANIKFAFGATEFTYDGKRKAVEVTAEDATGKNFKDFTVKYKASGDVSGNATTVAPTNVGTYQVTASLTDITNYQVTGESTATLTITAANVEVWASTGMQHQYDGIAKSITAMSTPRLDLDVAYYETSGDAVVQTVENPTTVGKYLYVIRLASSDANKNYSIGNALDTEPTGDINGVLGYSNTGIMTIDKSAQKAIGFGETLVNKLTTDSTFINPLTNPNEGASTSYSSSNENVATVSSDGTVSIVAPGSALITAISHLDGYTDTAAAYSLNVSKKEITVTVKNQSITYGKISPYDALDDLEFKDGNTVVSADAVCSSGATPTFTTNYAVGSSVGEYAVRASGLTSDKYNYVYEAGTLTVNPKTLVASDFTVTVGDKVYDGTDTAAVTAETSANAVVNSDVLMVTAVGSFDNATAGQGKTVNYEITGISGTKAGNYILGTADEMKGTATANITKAPVTLTVGEHNFAYDGDSKPISITAEYANGKNFKDFTVKYKASGDVSGNATTVAPSAVGEYDVEITLNNQTNYEIDNPELLNTLKLTITKAQITFAFGYSKFAYDGSNKPVAVSAYDSRGRVFSDYTVYYESSGDATPTYNRTDIAPSAVGEYKVTAEINSNNNNYVVKAETSNTATLEIDKGNVTVWAGGGTAQGYNGQSKNIAPMSAPDLSLEVKYYKIASADASGNATVGSEDSAHKDLGEYLYVITLSDSEAAQLANQNYSIGGAIDIDPTGNNVDKLISKYSNVGIMTISESIQSELAVPKSYITCTYGDEPITTQKATGGIEGATITYSIPNDIEQAVAEVNSTTGKLTIKKPGIAVVQATARCSGFTDSTVQYVVFVEKKTVEISLDDADSVVYSGTEQIAPYTITGEVSGNAISSDAIRFEYQHLGETNNPGKFRDVGTYLVTAALKDGNVYYRTVDTAAKQIEITRAPLEIRADNKTITYGDAAPEYTVTYYTKDHASGDATKLLGEDTENALSGNKNFRCKYRQYDDAGQYEISVHGLRSPNYKITFTKGELAVKQLPVQLEWTESQEFKYDGKEHSITATVTNAVNGDTVQVATYEKNTATDVGTYTAEAKTLTDDNYTLTGGTKLTQQWNIEQKKVTVGPKNICVNAGSKAELELDVSELLAGDRVYEGTADFKLTKDDGSEIELAEALKTAGTYKIEWTNSNAVTFNSNYDVKKETTATLTVKEVDYTGLLIAAGVTAAAIATVSIVAILTEQAEQVEAERTAAEAARILAEAKATAQQALNEALGGSNSAVVNELFNKGYRAVDDATTADEVMNATVEYVTLVSEAKNVRDTKITQNKLEAMKNGKIKASFENPQLDNVVNYQVTRATKKDFSENKKTFKVAAKDKDILTLTNSAGLVKGTKYYYKVRAKVQLSDGTIVYSQWSNVRYTKCKKTRK